MKNRNKELNELINFWGDLYLFRNGFELDDLFKKGRGSKDDRVCFYSMSKDVESSTFDRLLARSKFSYRVYYGSGSNSYRKYMNKDLYDFIVKNLSL